MNFALNKKKCIYIVIWLLIGLLSFTVLGKYASAPESHQATIASLDEKKATVLELTAATTATSALITLLPGDIGTPIAEKVADLSGYLLIVLCAVFLEKYLVTLTGYAAFKLFIPAACVLFAGNLILKNRSIGRLARRLLAFGICIFLVVPASQAVYKEALKEGLLQIFMEAGAIVMNPNCSVCWGSCQGVIGEGETLISTGTRNFKGRAGHRDSFVYLASAATVTASAIKGEIATADMLD